MSEILSRVVSMAKALWPSGHVSVVLRPCQDPVSVVVIDTGSPDAVALAGETGETVDLAVGSLGLRLRDMCHARAADLLRAAGEEQPAQRGVRGGARLDDGLLLAAILRAIGYDTPHTASAVVAAIRDAERRADERHEPVDGVAEKVVRHVVAEGVASAIDHNAGRYGHTPVVDALRDVLGKRDGQRVRIVVEVLPEEDGASR